VSAFDKITGILRERGEPAVWQGGNLRTRGLCHDGDARDTVTISHGKNNNVVIHCHKCGDNRGFLDALGLTDADLFDEETKPTAFTPRRKVATYTYCDDDGLVLFNVERWEPGKNGRLKDFLRTAPDGSYGTKGIRQVPYRLPAAKAEAAAGGTVLVVEGEKDVDNLTAIGVIATCNPGGAGKWTDDYTRHLAGCGQVIVVADRDKPGYAHAAQVADSMTRAGIPVRVVEPASGKDISDHLAAGFGFDDLKPVGHASTEAPDEDGIDWSDVDEQDLPRPGADIAWEEPIPLMPPKPPRLDAKLLRGIGTMAAAVEVSLQVPVDLPAWLGMAVASTAIGGRRTVSPKPDWDEPVTLYTMPVAAPGEMKSPALSFMAKPIYEEQARRREDDKHAVAKDRQDRRIAEACLSDAEAKVIKAGDAGKRKTARENMEAARLELEDMGDPKVLTQLVADDATPEAAVDVIAEQGERLAILSTEGSFLGNVGGRYSKSANPEIALKGWSQEPHPVNRKGRSLILERPNLSLGLAVQPGLLTGMGETGDVFQERGLMARFIFSMPGTKVGDRVYDTDRIPDDIREAYSASIKAMMRKIWDDKSTREMSLDRKAQESFRTFWLALEPRHKDRGDLAAVEGWAKKLPGQILRIAAVLALFEDPDTLVVSGEVMDDAIALVPYLVGHAKLVADLMSKQRQSKLGPARDVLVWMRDNHVAELNVTVLHKALNGRSWCEGVEDVEAAVGLLEDHGWVVKLPVPERPPGARGRPPKARFAVHPKVHSSDV
jgi:hypothetical protein